LFVLGYFTNQNKYSILFYKRQPMKT
jgi:hypothetical protein